MTSTQGLHFATTKQNLLATANEQWAREFYAAFLANASPATMRITDLAAPAPPTSDPALSRRATKPEINPAKASRLRNAARFPAVVLAALIVYSLGMPIFWFALLDFVDFVEHGESLLGPALDTILMAFGIGLSVVSLVAMVTEKRKRATSR